MIHPESPHAPLSVKTCLLPSLLLLLALPHSHCFAAPGSPGLPSARASMEKAVAFFRAHAGYRGAYVYRCGSDFAHREGENAAFAGTGWVEPPGTPAVGKAFLEAWRLTGSSLCLDAAVEAAHALVAGQLQSGGWDSRFELEPQHRQRYAYRTDGASPGKEKGNYSTFDDNKSQSALLLLMLVDEALEFKDAAIHEAVGYALERMLAVQYPNGAWPQQFARPVDAAQRPVLRASYPESWSRTFPKVDYRGYYTLNDGNMCDIIGMLFQAARIYGREDCRQAAERTGDFFLLAQMPDPQPGWAQQYDEQMHPVWARKFEPPAITGSESQEVMSTLLDLRRWTGNPKYLEPLPRALAYYETCLRPDGRLARFYELHTNKPLYFTKNYELTYRDDDMPTHYGFVVSSSLDQIRRRYEELQKDPPAQASPPVDIPRKPRLTSSLAKEAAQILAALDDRGAWLQAGKLEEWPEAEQPGQVVDSRTFVRNLRALAGFIAASEAEAEAANR